MKTLPTLALAAITLAAYDRVRRIHAHRTTARPSAKPAEVERWEGEGGGLPTGGPGAGVLVEPTPHLDPDLVQPGLGVAS
jgi:hypothetical protein